MQDKETSLPENKFALGGLAIPSEFLEKFLIYTRFFTNRNLITLNKKKYWEHEKVLLWWAYSKHHEHLGNPVNWHRFLHMYGINIIDSQSNEFKSEGEMLSFMEKNLNMELNANPEEKFRLTIEACAETYIVARFTIYGIINSNEIDLKNSNEIRNNFINVLSGDNKNYKGAMLQIMGNLVHKGLASSHLKRNDEVPQAIIINRSGILAGKIVEEAELRFGLLKYRLFFIFVRLVIILLLSYSVLQIVDQLSSFESEQTIGFIADFFSKLNKLSYIPISIVGCFLLKYLWDIS